MFCAACPSSRECLPVCIIACYKVTVLCCNLAHGKLSAVFLRRVDGRAVGGEVDCQRLEYCLKKAVLLEIEMDVVVYYLYCNSTCNHGSR